MATEKEIIELDNWRCQSWGCGRQDGLQVHHIIPKSKMGPNEPWNMITLCSFHHTLITVGKLTNIQLLEKILNSRFFRWAKALEWHLKRQGLKKANE